MSKKKNIQKILIVNPFGIGDVLFSTPLIRNVKKWDPEAQILYLCNKRVAPLLTNHPLIDKIFIYERDDFDMTRKKSISKWLMKIFSFLGAIHKERIAILIDLSMHPQFGFFGKLMGIKKRIGFNYRERGKFLTHKFDLEGFDEKHVAEHHLDLLRLVNIPVSSKKLELYVSEEDRLWTNKICRTYGFDDKPLISVAPFGGESFGKQELIKRWPLEKYGQLINKIIALHDARIFLLAGTKEKKEMAQLLSMIKERDKVYDATECSITKIAALVDKSSLIIANDTGSLRFANALNKKIITFFGPSDDTVYGLYPFDETKHIVLKRNLPCRPCYKKFRLEPCRRNGACLSWISVEETYAAVQELLK
ncbi:MAG: glycosyltransferase family 9 protein [Candidatus Omnitrophica bacterium]|nr:glycosyltransferase family 9 protein [Candidatus Omnitrophota bacterium]